MNDINHDVNNDVNNDVAHYQDLDLYRRVAQLPADKYALLAARLSLAHYSARQPRPSLADPANPRLTAYIANRQGQKTNSDELRAFARDRLPEYMVPQAFVFLGDLPRTPNGKVDRRALARLEPPPPPAEEQGDFVAPGSEPEQILARIWAEVLGLDEVGIHDDFFEVGGDSLLSIRILARANQAGLRISPEQFFAHPTVAQQAKLAGELSNIRTETGMVTGSAPLVPIQRWFFERVPVDPQHWNQSFLLSVSEDLDYAVLERAVQQILLHHDALRLNFTRSADGWQQSIGDFDAALPWVHVDQRALAAEARESMTLNVAKELNEGFELAQGPLMRFAFLETPPGRRNRLLIVTHHLIIDAVSWRIVLADLDTLCRQLQRGATPKLPAKTTSFKTWASRLDDYAQSAAVSSEYAYWKQLLAKADCALPVDFSAAPQSNRVASARTVSLSLEASQTDKLLHELPRVLHTQINEVVLAALAQAISGWTGNPAVLVDLEGHGREALFEDVDVSRTVGWFTSVFPLVLKLEEASQPGAALKAVKAQLREIPKRGLGYGLLRELSRDTATAGSLRETPNAQICFNYLGQLDRLVEESALFQIEQDDFGPSRSLQGMRPYLLEINTRVANGRLCADWTYSERFHRRSTIERIAEDFMSRLRELIAYSASPKTDGVIASDFPLANLDEAELDGLSRLLDEIDDASPGSD